MLPNRSAVVPLDPLETLRELELRKVVNIAPTQLTPNALNSQGSYDHILSLFSQMSSDNFSKIIFKLNKKFGN
jgi:hypothetical protein